MYEPGAKPLYEEVDLNLYGNVAPAVSAPTIAFQNSGSEISASFTISQNIFNGELQDIVINWGDGTTSSYNGLAPGSCRWADQLSVCCQGLDLGCQPFRRCMK